MLRLTQDIDKQAMQSFFYSLICIVLVYAAFAPKSLNALSGLPHGGGWNPDTNEATIADNSLTPPGLALSTQSNTFNTSRTVAIYTKAMFLLGGERIKLLPALQGLGRFLILFGMFLVGYNLWMENIKKAVFVFSTVVLGGIIINWYCNQANSQAQNIAYGMLYEIRKDKYYIL